jgi:hypothetical protein
VGEREGGRGEVAGAERERGGSPAAFVFVPRPGRVLGLEKKLEAREPARAR